MTVDNALILFCINRSCLLPHSSLQVALEMHTCSLISQWEEGLMSQTSAHIIYLIVRWPGCLLKEVLLKLVFGAAMFLISLQMLLSG
jgi:hypothetical protein